MYSLLGYSPAAQLTHVIPEVKTKPDKQVQVAESALAVGQARQEVEVESK